MQKLQQISIILLIVFAAIGTGKLIAYMGNFSIGSIKTEVTASSDASADTSTAAVPETPPTETAIIASSTATPETAPIQSPTPVAPITESTSPATTSVPSSTITITSEKDEVKEIKEAEKVEKEELKPELTVKEKREARLLAEKNKNKEKLEKEEVELKEEAKASPPAEEPLSSTSTEIEKEPEVTASADESKETPIAEPPSESAPKPAPAPVPTTNQQNENDKKEKLAKLKKIKNQPKLNKKILETIQAMRIIPDLFKQMGIVKDNGEKVDKKRPQNSLEIFTELIKMLTDNLQDNTLALEEMLNDVYEAQETQISHGRCISATYFTYSDTENSCIMISRKICRTKDIVPDNRYDTIELCKADHGLVEKISESREVLAFKKQKDEYLQKLTTLQIAYKYYSVRWEELVDLVQDATDFDALGTAGNTVNLYRMEQGETGETGKSASEVASTPDSTQLAPLSAASIQ